MWNFQQTIDSNNENFSFVFMKTSRLLPRILFLGMQFTSIALIGSNPDGLSTEADLENPGPRKVAIFAANRSESGLNEQLPILEDLVAAKLTGEGFSVISRDIVLSVVGDLKKRSSINKLDAALDDQTSALRLSQNLGADYLLFVSILGHDVSSRRVNAYGISVLNLNNTLRTTYRIINGNTGGSLLADSFESTQTIQQTKYSTTDNPGIIRDLLNDAAGEMVSNLLKKTEAGKLQDVQLSRDAVEFGIAVGIADVNFPEIIEDSDGKLQLTANRGTVQALAVTVELDGMLIGTTGTTELVPMFKVAPGLHRLKLSREDLETWERVVNVVDGMVLNVSMQLNEEGLKRWRENTEIFNKMKKEAKLSDAEAELIRAKAERMRNSYFRINIDNRQDVKVDTDEAIQIENNQGMIQ